MRSITELYSLGLPCPRFKVKIRHCPEEKCTCIDGYCRYDGATRRVMRVRRLRGKSSYIIHLPLSIATDVIIQILRSLAHVACSFISCSQYLLVKKKRKRRHEKHITNREEIEQNNIKNINIKNIKNKNKKHKHEKHKHEMINMKKINMEIR